MQNITKRQTTLLKMKKEPRFFQRLKPKVGYLLFLQNGK